MDLKEMVQGIQVEASAGIMEVAFKTKGVTPAQFPGSARGGCAGGGGGARDASEPELPPSRAAAEAGCRRGPRLPPSPSLR